MLRILWLDSYRDFYGWANFAKNVRRHWISNIQTVITHGIPKLREKDLRCVIYSIYNYFWKADSWINRHDDLVVNLSFKLCPHFHFGRHTLVVLCLLTKQVSDRITPQVCTCFRNDRSLLPWIWRVATVVPLCQPWPVPVRY